MVNANEQTLTIAIAQKMIRMTAKLLLILSQRNKKRVPTLKMHDYSFSVFLEDI